MQRSKNQVVALKLLSNLYKDLICYPCVTCKKKASQTLDLQVIMRPLNVESLRLLSNL
jgi:hypothetical protein